MQRNAIRKPGKFEPKHTSPEQVDLDRLVFDPEYRARMRDRLNSSRRPKAKRAPGA
ncbi:MAG: hypothetical protein HOF95_07520 [Rhodospirillales bacterium]|jgi:hypothetical protein|nr:hypothetical protein [Rhodospirillales bacterium]MBT4007118.1 hypothetical protein [Rhodospirillales bacterium]MBT5076934.1 hypothetical protein [Rhodospirillales bacterium]MBT5113451.1 hypothetical protein [Rhodospirillales bacterium]MBT5673749.1 hypothetical protein [Rhodospirillales bacterium]